LTGAATKSQVIEIQLKSNMKSPYKQLVLVEFRNCPPFLYDIVSDKPISIDKVVQHFIDTEDFNDERDSITFIDEITEVKL
jgi:hypothetical protein